jgi:Na+/melibiose symporter-like transporter
MKQLLYELGYFVIIENVLKSKHYKWVFMCYLLILKISYIINFFVENQIDILIHNHLNLKNNGQMIFNWSVWYVVEKISMRGTKRLGCKVESNDILMM